MENMTKEFHISAYEHPFRIKKMNAIELFALRTQIDFKNYDFALETFELILEKIEVNCGDSWLPVREAGKNGAIYFPVGIENNIDAIDELSSEFMKRFRAVFQKSNASNESQTSQQ